MAQEAGIKRATYVELEPIEGSDTLEMMTITAGYEGHLRQPGEVRQPAGQVAAFSDHREPGGVAAAGRAEPQCDPEDRYFRQGAPGANVMKLGANEPKKLFDSAAHWCRGRLSEFLRRARRRPTPARSGRDPDFARTRAGRRSSASATCSASPSPRSGNACAERRISSRAPSKRPEDRIDPAKIDPTLRLDLLAKVQEVEAAGPAAQLVSIRAASVKALPPEPKVPFPSRCRWPRPEPPKPSPASTASPIPLRYYGLLRRPATNRKTAFFLDGEEILVAKEGKRSNGDTAWCASAPQFRSSWRTPSRSRSRRLPLRGDCRMKKRRPRESGFALLLVFLMAGIIAITLYHADSARRLRGERQKSSCSSSAASSISAPSSSSSRPTTAIRPRSRISRASTIAASCGISSSTR